VEDLFTKDPREGGGIITNIGTAYQLSRAFERHMKTHYEGNLTTKKANKNQRKHNVEGDILQAVNF